MGPETESPIVVPAQPESSASHASTGSDSAGGLSLTEDLALALLKRPDLLAQDVEQLARNTALLKSRKIRLAVAAHPCAPRRIALRLIRELYTSDLARFSLTPAVAADLKHVADELLVARLASVTLGERIALARRCSAQVAAALLLDKEPRVWHAALENPRITETAIAKALQRAQATAAFVVAVCHHAKWSLRHEIRMALLRNAHTPLARALEFARHLPPPLLRDILHTSRLPQKIKEYLLQDLLKK